MFKVTFKFEGAEDVITYAQEGENLLEIARKSNVAIDAPCSGNASCGKCRVKLIGGEIESPKTRHITDEEYAEGWRLACVSKVTGDVEVQVPDIASAYRSRMKVADLSSKEEVAIFEKAKSDVESAGISLTNSLDVINVKMNVPTLDDTMPDNERLVRAIKNRQELKKYGCHIQYCVKFLMFSEKAILKYSVSLEAQKMIFLFMMSIKKMKKW